MPADRLPHLRCCAQGARLVALRFAADVIYAEHPDRAAAISSYASTPPRWTIVAVPSDSRGGEDVVVVVCPFCGAALPAIRPRANPPRRVCAVVDGGYYCATCEERLMGCRCWPQERMWETGTRLDTAKRERADRRGRRR
jgi:hypothetical protein